MAHTSDSPVAEFDPFDPAFHPDSPAVKAAVRRTGTATEEVLRLNPSISVTTRLAVEDLTYKGLHIPAGTFLLLFLGSANTDPAVFGDATFDIAAERPPNLTFGGGIHVCTGRMLARIELQVAWPILARGLGPVELTGTPTWRAPVGVVGPITLPIRYAGAPGRAA